MRYVVLILAALLASMITGGIAPQVAILGAEPDILLIVMLAMVLCERTATPVITCSVAAIFMDAFLAPALGYYSFPYLLMGLLVYFVFRKRTIHPLFTPPVICAACWLIKDLITAFITFLMGNTFDFGYIFVHSTLPGILVNGVLILPFYLLFYWLYGFGFMRPSSISQDSDFLSARKNRGARR